MRVLRDLYLSRVWKTPGFYYAFAFLVGFLSFLPTAMGDLQQAPIDIEYEYPFALCGAILMTYISGGFMLSWGHTFANIRTSDLDRRLKVSKMTRIEYYSYSFLYSIFLYLAIALMGFVIFAIYDASGLIKNTHGNSFNWSKANWGLIFTAFIVNYFTSLSLSMVFACFSNEFSKYITILAIYSVLLVTIGGASTPMFTIRDLNYSDPLLPFTILSWATPHASVGFLAASAFGSSYGGIDAFTQTQDILNSLIPIAYAIVGFIFVGIKIYHEEIY